MFGLSKKEKLVKYLTTNGFVAEDSNTYKADKIHVVLDQDCYRIFANTYCIPFSKFKYSDDIQDALRESREKATYKLEKFLKNAGCVLIPVTTLAKVYRPPEHVVADTIRIVGDWVYTANSVGDPIIEFSIYERHEDFLGDITKPNLPPLLTENPDMYRKLRELGVSDSTLIKIGSLKCSEHTKYFTKEDFDNDRHLWIALTKTKTNFGVV